MNNKDGLILIKYFIAKIFLIAIIFGLISLSSCSKEKDDFTTSATALKFIEKEQVNLKNFQYKYVVLKYNNSWYSEILPNNKKRIFTEVLKIDVYSNDEKPMNRWVDYVEWKKDTTILTFRNNTIDSMPRFFKRLNVTEEELYQL